MDQRGVYDFVTGHVASGETFFLVLQGPAGCGKSFLYKCLRQDLGGKIIFLAPTGVAALLVAGSTIHSGLSLNPESKGITEVSNLGPLQKAFEGVKVIAIDESSMLGRRTFGQVVARLRDIFDGTGISLLLAGDAMQLPPVKQKPLWSKATVTVDPEVPTGAAAEGAAAEGATAPHGKVRRAIGWGKAKG